MSKLPTKIWEAPNCFTVFLILKNKEKFLFESNYLKKSYVPSPKFYNFGGRYTLNPIENLQYFQKIYDIFKKSTIFSEIYNIFS